MSISLTVVDLASEFVVCLIAYALGYRRGRRQLDVMLRRAGSRLSSGAEQ